MPFDPRQARPAIGDAPAGPEAPPAPGTEQDAGAMPTDPGTIAAQLLQLPPEVLASVMHIVEQATQAAADSDPNAQQPQGPPQAGPPMQPGMPPA